MTKCITVATKKPYSRRKHRMQTPCISTLGVDWRDWRQTAILQLKGSSSKLASKRQEGKLQETYGVSVGRRGSIQTKFGLPCASSTTNGLSKHSPTLCPTTAQRQRQAGFRSKKSTLYNIVRLERYARSQRQRAGTPQSSSSASRRHSTQSGTMA